MSGLKLYVFGKTLLNVDNIQSLKEVLPTKKQIIQHIVLQKVDKKKDFEMMPIAVEETKFNEIVKEISRKNCRQFVANQIVITMEDSNHPVVLINKKSDESSKV